jgi:hypothetical protein
VPATLDATKEETSPDEDEVYSGFADYTFQGMIVVQVFDSVNVFEQRFPTASRERRAGPRHSAL